jgi:hypothetical protein
MPIASRQDGRGPVLDRMADRVWASYFSRGVCAMIKAKRVPDLFIGQ